VDLVVAAVQTSLILLNVLVALYALGPQNHLDHPGHNPTVQ
jgi:hypothetical protein